MHELEGWRCGGAETLTLRLRYGHVYPAGAGAVHYRYLTGTGFPEATMCFDQTLTSLFD
jgi:hypothetical protein